MKKILFIFTTILIIFSCKQQKNFDDFTKDNITGAKLWERITKEDNYKRYKNWSDHEGVQPGVSPHGRYHEVFINSKLSDSLPIADKIAPNGSIIVKENYTLVNTKIAYELNKYIDIFIKAKNILNMKYEMNYNYPMPGITIFGGINLHYKSMTSDKK